MVFANDHSFVAWEEHILCHDRGNRVVHYYLKDLTGDLVLAVIGTERSIRHMMYVVSDQFLKAYGSKGSINSCTKWRARREVVEWLTSLVSRQRLLDVSNSPTNDSTQAVSLTEFRGRQTHLPDQMVPRKLKVQYSGIEWSGIAWICAKQLKHYPAFFRNGTTIGVHSFVFIMALEDYHYLGYLEDMYEDKKGQKKVKVRWFHHNQEVKDVIPQLNPHPKEVFITPHVQVISAECIDGLATVLTPKHYEKCLEKVANNSSPGVYMCFRQFKNHKLRPFTLAKLRGYSNQAILSSIDDQVVFKQKLKGYKLCGEDGEDFECDDLVGLGSKRNRSHKEHQGLETGGPKCDPTSQKLKLRLSRKMMGMKFVTPEPQCSISFKVDERIELLCQDSGMRGCWFRCKVVQVSQKLLKVQYDDVLDVDESGNLEEWIPAYRVAAPDRLGIRCSGRLRIRPCPPEDSTDFTFVVGAPVDAWWCDGWWEAVVTGIGISGTDLQVYLPGEEKFLTLQKKDIRASKDWIGNKWIDLKAKPDILLFLSENVSPNLKMDEVAGSKVNMIPKPDIVGGRQGLADLVTPIDLLENVKDSNPKKRSHINNGDETNNSNGSDSGIDDADGGNEEKSVLVEDGLNEKCEASEAIEVTK
ncbi:uncharacterized protein LOC107415399 [Ziziphus jujuba]|uniref:Uncharacterized protein LOC107415399 isoform X1 n=1 Tax=Ziziphus jujuba TaxID=326968 RepID=A0A6P3ZKR9_ZIZJJ|nr:uncharacterized protein LOC107415399 [Ziziphus jujuba]XP_015879217.1 uncharacterized protein LOC107415399 [Ziziphus jujuba]